MKLDGPKNLSGRSQGRKLIGHKKFKKMFKKDKNWTVQRDETEPSNGMKLDGNTSRRSKSMKLKALEGLNF